MRSVLALAMFASCDGGRSCPTTCGIGSRSDCCESNFVAGGTFYRNYDVASDNMFPDMSHPATLSDFRLDKFEVTVGRFRAFVESGGGTQSRPPSPGQGAHPKIPGSGWDSEMDAFLEANTTSFTKALSCDPGFATWTDIASDRESLPINCVSWYEAMAFCIWDDGYLPTAAEWNYAATGGDEQRAYPWSDPPAAVAIDCSRANYTDVTGKCLGVEAPGNKPQGDGRWSQSDLAGNVDEWVLDWYGGLLSPNFIDPCDDCAMVTPDPKYTSRAVRGGRFNVTSIYLRGADWREGLDPANRTFEIGIRCARSPHGP